MFHAGSLTVPFQAMEKTFEAKYPKVDMLREAGGSTKMAQMISELHKPADIMASADHAVIDKTLIWKYAENPEAANVFLQYLLDPEGGLKIHKRDGTAAFRAGPGSQRGNEEQAARSSPGIGRSQELAHSGLTLPLSGDLSGNDQCGRADNERTAGPAGSVCLAWTDPKRSRCTGE